MLCDFREEELLGCCLAGNMYLKCSCVFFAAIAEHRGSIVGPGHAAPPAVASSGVRNSDSQFLYKDPLILKKEGCLKYNPVLIICKNEKNKV